MFLGVRLPRVSDEAQRLGRKILLRQAFLPECLESLLGVLS